MGSWLSYMTSSGGVGIRRHGGGFQRVHIPWFFLYNVHLGRTLVAADSWGRVLDLMWAASLGALPKESTTVWFPNDGGVRIVEDGFVVMVEGKLVPVSAQDNDFTFRMEAGEWMTLVGHIARGLGFNICEWVARGLAEKLQAEGACHGMKKPTADTLFVSLDDAGRVDI